MGCPRFSPGTILSSPPHFAGKASRLFGDQLAKRQIRRLYRQERRGRQSHRNHRQTGFLLQGRAPRPRQVGLQVGPEDNCT